MADDPDAARMALHPVADVVHFTVDHEPLVAPSAVLLHLLPGKDARAAPSFLQCRIGLLTSAAHLQLPSDCDLYTEALGSVSLSEGWGECTNEKTNNKPSKWATPFIYLRV